MSLIDPSRATPRDLLIVGLMLIVAVWIGHEFVLIPGRLNDQLCERVDVLEMDKMSEEARGALDEMSRICRERRPMIEGP